MVDDSSINSKNVDFVYWNISKAFNIFTKRFKLKFEEVDIVLHRLDAEWEQKRMQMYFQWCIQELVKGYTPKPPGDQPFIR